MKIILGFILGASLGLGAPALAGEDIGPDKHLPQANCHKWNDKSTQQCTTYFSNVNHMRWVAYEDGQWSITVDWFPGNLKPVVRTTNADDS